MMRTRNLRLGLLSLFVSCLLLSAEDWRLHPWARLSNDPIISPRGDSWESAGTFNPAVIEHSGKLVMLYRAQDKFGTSRLGYAESADGVHFNRSSQPVLSPQAEYEKNGGVEDPRLVKLGSTYYLTYTGVQQKRCAAVPGDFQRFASLAAPRRDPAGLQRQVECRLDKVRSHRARKDRGQVLDVFSRHRSR